jgi:DNA-binding HxlR family transcriptional regulator
MALGKDYVNQACAMARALELVGERWTLLIVRDAFYGVRRYSDFLAHLHMPRAVLAERLHLLTEGGVLVKQPAENSSREEYVLTPRGEALWPVLAALSAWATQELLEGEASWFYRHAECGTLLPDRLTCTTCKVRIHPREVLMEPGPGADLTRTDPVSVACRSPRRLLQPIR